MKQSWSKWILLATVAVVFVWLKFGYHELWKDEWQAWMVARDMSLSDMLSFLNYEGHPSLWYLYLRPWTWLAGSEELYLNIAHTIPYLIVLYLMIWHLRMPLVYKVLILFSYFFFFEYGIVSRGYIWVILFSISALIGLRRKSNVWLTVSLFLLCQTEVYGVMIGACILLYACIQDYHGQDYGSWLKHTLKDRKWIVMGFGVGILLFIWTVAPRGHEDDFTRAYIQGGMSFGRFMSSFQGLFANTFGIGYISNTSLSGVSVFGILYSLLALFISFFTLKESKSSMLVWAVGCLGFMIFGNFIFEGGVRQWGMLFLLYVLCLEWSGLSFDMKKIISWLSIVVLFLAPVLHNAKAVYEEITSPFSNAKEAGLYIAETIPEQVPVVAINKFECAPVGAYARRPLYELPEGKPFTYFRWLEKVYIPTQSELQLFAKFKKVGGLVIISPTELDANRFPEARLGKRFDQRSIKRENYYLYTLTAQ